MERADTLIKRLVEQQQANAGSAALLNTAQMLVNELQEQNKTEKVTGNKVSVIYPAPKPVEMHRPEVPRQEEAIKPVTVEAPVNIPVPKEPEIPKIAEIKKEIPRPAMPAANIEELPTFAYQQKEVFELNETVAERKEQTLNERLNTGKRELGSYLKESPVKDLRKAIGINDRFVFIDELFRGDENMYERSIKTINGFSIFPEAEYWIQRELKVKIGWDEESPTVQHFDQLVRRRFS